MAKRKFSASEQAKVKRLASQGVTVHDVARIVRTNLATLMKHFPEVFPKGRLSTGTMAPEWTPEQRDMITALAGFGHTMDEIASVVKVTPDQLRAYFAEELTIGHVVANARVATKLYDMALSGDHVAATIFWMKARANWTEKVTVVGNVGHHHEHHHEIDPGTLAREPMKELDDNGRDALRQVLTQLGAGSVTRPLDDEPPTDEDSVH